MRLVSLEIENFQSLQTTLPFGENQVVGERIDTFDLHGRAVRDQLFPVFWPGFESGAVTTRKFFAPLFVRI